MPKARDKDIPVAFLRDYFDLRDDGVLIWKALPREMFRSKRIWKARNTRVGGEEAGGINEYGYIATEVRWAGRRRRLLAHRIIWALKTGAWPSDEIDHCDGNRCNNRFNNLREAIASEQPQNSKLYSSNRSGFRGVSWNAACCQWQAHISAENKNRYLGLFASREDAYSAYLAAKSALHPFQPRPR